MISVVKTTLLAAFYTAYFSTAGNNPLKAGIVKTLEEYPYSSYNYFLQDQVPQCLSNSWIVQNHGKDKQAIIEMLNAPIDTEQLRELKRAASLVEAPNINTRPKEKDLIKLFENISDIKTRNQIILKAIEQGYSQHMIAKVLDISQPAVNGVVKRSKK